MHPPVAAGSALYLRLTTAGTVNRCYRPGRDVRIAALGRGKALTVTQLAEGDLINVEGTVLFGRS